ncbi:742_t:CDS:2 [Diversispora eburnea]|uniref:742_t:CDS:1 n=1 Tax=Diversispora eburnea TaxID=1213867 RepID=A0A9N9G4T2_9GLOM|nr:742_t:CDS:2 [Diversispora eburnea]
MTLKPRQPPNAFIQPMEGGGDYCQIFRKIRRFIPVFVPNDSQAETVANLLEPSTSLNGFIPVFVPNDSQAETVANLLEPSTSLNEYRYRSRRPQERKRSGQATAKKQTAQQKQQSQQLRTSLTPLQHPNPKIEKITTPQNETNETITPPNASLQQIPYTQSLENSLHNTFNIGEVKAGFTFNVESMIC